MIAFELTIPPMESAMIRYRLKRLYLTADRHGLTVTPSTKELSPTNRGGLMVVETSTLRIIAGRHFSLSLADAEDIVFDLVAVPVPYADVA